MDKKLIGTKKGQKTINGEHEIRAKNQIDDSEQEDNQVKNFSDMQLKQDYEQYPLFISRDFTMFLEAFNPLYRIAYEFIINIAEPIQRPQYVHEFQITQFSLYTARILQYEPEDIITVLEELSQNEQIPDNVKLFIQKNTDQQRTAKLFLKEKQYYLDIHAEVYENLLLKENQLNDMMEIVGSAEAIKQNEELVQIKQDVNTLLQMNQESLMEILREQSASIDLNNQDFQEQKFQQVIPSLILSQENDINLVNSQQPQNLDQMDILQPNSKQAPKKSQTLDPKEDREESDKSNEDDQEDGNENENEIKNENENEIKNENENENNGALRQNYSEVQSQFFRFKIQGDHFELSQYLIQNDIPLIQEYDFNKQFETIPSENILDIDLQQNRKPRFYQDRALKNIFIQGKARSGLVILPCGAGKTIVGIIAIQRIQRSTVIICDSEVSVDQWCDELQQWTTIKRKQIVRLSGQVKDKWENQEEPVIIVTTYHMIVSKRGCRENEIISAMKQRKNEWGVCVIDEVHQLPAQTFQNVLKQFKFHFKLGLTATPYREDEKINNLFFMIGPKLYQQNWQDLMKESYLAKPYCVEIRCDMANIFQKEYKIQTGDKKTLLHTANPTQFYALQYLLRVHEDRGDQILVFCDRPKILEYYANKLSYPVIHGEVNQDERKQIFGFFKTSNNINTVFLSRVGDTAIDLPEANVGIQIGVHFKSRRQQVQRLGRIMRQKDNPNGDYNAFWYTLVSDETQEQKYCEARQQCLIDQGFSYEIVKQSNLPYNTLTDPKSKKKFSHIQRMEIDQQINLIHDLFMEQQNKSVMKKQESEQSASASSSSDEQEKVPILKLKQKSEFNKFNIQYVEG